MTHAPGTARGIGMSLRLYHGDPARKRAMDALYRRFVPSGGCAFDIGAHVGDRVSSFRRLGARVVAVEPQPGAMRALRLIHGRDPGVTLCLAAAGAARGEMGLRLNIRNPTVSTLSPDFIAAADGAEGWHDQVWDAEVPVAVTTLDDLIARHGTPDFIKIDVEGFEAEALAGLSRPVAALSFEFTTIQRDVALRCVARLAALGDHVFNLALGETQTLAADKWMSAGAIRDAIADLPHAANSGDVYARHRSG